MDRILIIVTAGIFLVSCGAPRMESGTLEGKSAILDAANKALSQENCTEAIALIDGVYGSLYTDNDVRKVRAAAYACAAGVNFLSMVGSLVSNSLVGVELWKTLSKLFTVTDTTQYASRSAAGGYAQDALMSIFPLGTVVTTANKFLSTSYNPGSYEMTDRSDDSNVHLMFTAMATIGNLQNLYSSPNSSYVKTNVLGYSASKTLGWAVATNVNEDGCSYAASVLNMLDGITAIADQLSGTLKTSLQTVQTTLSTAMDAACNAGCTGSAATTIVAQAIDFSGTGCSFTDTLCKGTSTQPCLKGLRYRSNCTAAITDRYSCAAAGIARLINVHAVIGWN